MLCECPSIVKSRGRVYLSKRERREVLPDTATPGVTYPKYGHTTPVVVTVAVLERTPPWAEAPTDCGTYRREATFETQLGYYGEVAIPRPIRDRLALAYGDTCRVTVEQCGDPDWDPDDEGGETHVEKTDERTDGSAEQTTPVETAEVSAIRSIIID